MDRPFQFLAETSVTNGSKVPLEADSKAITVLPPEPEGNAVWCDKCEQYHQSSLSPTANPCLKHRTKRDEEGRLIPCSNAAAYGTDCCPKHGIGYREKPGGRPLTTGKYTRQLSVGLLERIDKSLNDPELLSLREDLVIIERMIAGRLANFEQDGEVIVPTKSELKEYLNLVAAKRKLADAERLAMKESREFMTLQQLGLMGKRLSEILRQRIADPQILALIMGDVRELMGGKRWDI